MSENKKPTPTAACGFCPEGRECAVCLGHMCQGTPEGWSTCTSCLNAAIAAGTLEKNDKGQYLDPAKRTPIATCKCGMVMNPGNLWCRDKAIRGDKQHGFVV